MSGAEFSAEGIVVGLALLVIIWQTKELLSSTRRMERRLLRVEFKLGISPEGLDGEDGTFGGKA